MDADIARWTLEFLLRHAMDDTTMNRILSILPLPNDNHRLKKMVLLKTIEFEVSDGSVSENMLDSIEAIAELDKRGGIAIMESIKDAYCTVAVECTARFMKESMFQEAVKRIWRERIPKVAKSEAAACLISDQLQNWKDEFDAAVCDASIRENILAMNTRNTALKVVRVYVAEAWKVMGPTFIEMAAEKLSILGAEARGIVNDGVSDQIGDKATSLVIGNRELGESSHQDLDISAKPEMREKDQVEVKEREATLPSVGRDLGVGSRRAAMKDEDNVGNREASLSNAGQELGVGDRVIINDEDHVGEEASTSHRDMDVMGDNDGGEKGAETLPNIGQDSPPTTTDRNQRAEPSPIVPAMRDQETQKVNVLPKCKGVSSHGRPSRGRVKITDAEELSVETSRNDRMEVGVENPSINLGVEFIQANEGSSGNQCSVSESVEFVQANERNLGNQCSVEERVRVELVQVNEGNPGNERSISGSAKPIQVNEGDLGNQCSRHENDVPRRSLMGQNSTAHTYELKDSVDDSIPSTKRHLRPKRKAVSPPLKREAGSPLRRKVKKWSVLEEDTLRAGVHKYGKGNWKDILNHYQDIFEERTQVDLKDKWRNLSRS